MLSQQVVNFFSRLGSDLVALFLGQRLAVVAGFNRDDERVNYPCTADYGKRDAGSEYYRSYGTLVPVEESTDPQLDAQCEAHARSSVAQKGTRHA